MRDPHDGAPRQPVLRRRIAWRVVGVAVLACVLGALGAVLMTAVALRELSSSRVATLVQAAGGPYVAAACSGAPIAGEAPTGVRYEVFDDAGAPLARADVAPLAPGLRARARSAPRATEFELATRESRVVWRIEGPGRCAFAQARFRPRAGSSTSFALGLVLMLGALAVGVALLVRASVAAPLLDRIEGLASHAARVGTDRYRASDIAHDESDDIARALDEAHSTSLARVAEEARHRAELEQFVADVAHDVRTPLSSLALALDEIADLGEGEALPSLARALNDVVYLRSLTATLALAQGDRGARRESVDLRAVAERVIARAEPFALRRGIALTSTLVDARVWGEALASEQILTNLVENAIAHGDPEVTVHVHLSLLEDRVRVVVEDDGPGVFDDELPRLAERSFRGEGARSRGARGTGLGLAITRALSERMGFALTFTRRAPRGLCVSVEAPRADRPLATLPPQTITQSVDVGPTRSDDEETS